ncbi:MAG: hypothetical protein ACYC9P_07910, partial [Rudaea sp.]
MNEIYLESFGFASKPSAHLDFSTKTIDAKQCVRYVMDLRDKGALPVFIARTTPKPFYTLETMRHLLQARTMKVHEIENDVPIMMLTVPLDDEKKTSHIVEAFIAKGGMARDVCIIDTKAFHTEINHLEPKAFEAILRRLNVAVVGLGNAASKVLDQLGKPDRLDAAREDRDDLLKSVTWFDSAKVAKISGTTAESNPAQHASRLRREKRLFGVRYKGEYLHPEFQFRQSGDVHPAIGRLLQVLPSTDANWTAAFWLFQPHGRLGGKSPAAVF